MPCLMRREIFVLTVETFILGLFRQIKSTVCGCLSLVEIAHKSTLVLNHN